MEGVTTAGSITIRLLLFIMMDDYFYIFGLEK